MSPPAPGMDGSRPGDLRSPGSFGRCSRRRPGKFNPRWECRRRSRGKILHMSQTPARPCVDRRRGFVAVLVPIAALSSRPCSFPGGRGGGRPRARSARRAPLERIDRPDLASERRLSAAPRHSRRTSPCRVRRSGDEHSRRGNWQSDTVFTLQLSWHLDFNLGASQRVAKLAIWEHRGGVCGRALRRGGGGARQRAERGELCPSPNHSSFPFSYPVDLLALSTPRPGALHPVGDQLGLPHRPGFQLRLRRRWRGGGLGRSACRAAGDRHRGATERRCHCDFHRHTRNGLNPRRGPFLEAPGNPAGSVPHSKGRPNIATVFSALPAVAAICRRRACSSFSRIGFLRSSTFFAFRRGHKRPHGDYCRADHFAAMAYILAVNPQILSTTGMDFGAVVTATALASALMTAVFALVTNWPIALAPGMGLNAFFAFTICGAMRFRGRRRWRWSFAAARVSAALTHWLAAADHRGDSARAEDRDLLRHRPVYRLHRFAERRDHRGESGDAGDRRAARFATRAARARRHCARGGAAFRRVEGAIVLSVLALTAVGLVIPAADGGCSRNCRRRLSTRPLRLRRLFSRSISAISSRTRPVAAADPRISLRRSLR